MYLLCDVAAELHLEPGDRVVARVPVRHRPVLLLQLHYVHLVPSYRVMEVHRYSKATVVKRTQPSLVSDSESL